MCGIFGIYNTDLNYANENFLRLCSENMFHRGPDDEGIIKKDHWALGMRRLSIIDVSGGHQPISNQQNNIHLVANGEIYNFKELRTKLIELGYSFKTKTDVEVIIQLYHQEVLKIHK